MKFDIDLTRNEQANFITRSSLTGDFSHLYGEINGNFLKLCYRFLLFIVYRYKKNMTNVWKLHYFRWLNSLVINARKTLTGSIILDKHVFMSIKIQFYSKLLVALFRNCISLSLDVLLYYDCKLWNNMQWLLSQNYFDSHRNIFNVSLIDSNDFHILHSYNILTKLNITYISQINIHNNYNYFYLLFVSKQ